MERNEEKYIVFRQIDGIFKKMNATQLKRGEENRYTLLLTLNDTWETANPTAIFASGTKRIFVPLQYRIGNTYAFFIPPEMLRFSVFSFALISRDLHASVPCDLTVCK